jgi:uncharacterized protein YcnI
MKTLLVLVICFGSSVVFAHPSFVDETIPAGKVAKVDMMVTHGCGDSPTIRIVMEVPEEVLAVTPRVKPGWNIELVESKLSENRVVFGMERSKYTSQVIWSGGSLSSDYFDLFSFIVIPPGEEVKLFFPTTQHCEEGVDAYTGVPDPSKPDEQVDNLAPWLNVVRHGTSKGH